MTCGSPVWRPIRTRTGPPASDLCASGGARHCVLGTGECDEERIALRVYFDAAVPFECLAQQPPVLGERVGIVVTELVEQARRPLDIREEEGDGAARQVAHAPMIRQKRPGA